MNSRRRRVLDAAASAAFAALPGAPAREGGGDALALELPEVAENGFSVPLAFSVSSPTSAADHVDAVLILAPENPHAVVATSRLTPASGTARAATRIRLARTQTATALARTSTGVAPHDARRARRGGRLRCLSPRCPGRYPSPRCPCTRYPGARARSRA